MKIGLPFPNGHDLEIEIDKEMESKGKFDKEAKNKIIRIKGFTEEDILILRQMILDEVKKQIEEKEEYGKKVE
jgi:hypothetical protein